MRTSNLLTAFVVAFTAFPAMSIAHASFGARGAVHMPVGNAPTARTSTVSTSSSAPNANASGWNHANAPAHVTGQPSQSCGSVAAPTTPGNAAAAPGSAFNPNGQAGTVYAGQQPQNSRNTASVSQYDVACARP
ncbi:MAG: hypothetical protein KGM49_06705 [Sphingomonadales bacterium]|nr:hypothetical protein [Sphingomonadales bacterium]